MRLDDPVVIKYPLQDESVFIHGDKVPWLDRASRVSEVIFAVALVQSLYNRWSFESAAALRLSVAKKQRRVFLPSRYHYYQMHCKKVLLMVSWIPLGSPASTDALHRRLC